MIEETSLTVFAHGSPLSPVHPSFYGTSSARCESESLNSDEGELIRNHESVVDDEVKHILKLALPVMASYTLEMFPAIMTIAFVGHIESPNAEEEIAAAALSILFLNVTGLATGQGLATALDTLCSQAHGSGNTIRMGLYFQTGLIILSVCFIFVFYVNFYSSDILEMLGQPIAVAQKAGNFSCYLLPGVPFIYLYDLLKRVLQAQNIASPMVYVNIFSNIIYLIVGYYLCFHTSLGFLGAAVSRTILNITCPIILVPYMIVSGLMTPIWTGFEYRKAFEGVHEFLVLGIPGMLQLCFEWWAFEIIALLAGILPQDPVANIGSNALMLNLSYATWTLYGGLSVAANVRTGNALGAGSSTRAAVVWKVSLILSAAFSLLCSGFFLTFRTQLPYIFTHDKSIDSLASSLIYVAAAFQIVDSINASVQGILRGSGRQILGAKLNFLAYYAIGLPIGVVLASKFNLGVIGLWIGMTVGLTVTTIVGGYLVFNSNWAVLILEAQHRTSGTGDLLHHHYTVLGDVPI